MYIGCWGGKGCCCGCDVAFGEWDGGKGILKFNENKKICAGCSKNKILVSLPKCNHTLCVECLKIVYYGDKGNFIKRGTIAKNKCPFCKK
jgi:hypothetical protein